VLRQLAGTIRFDLQRGDSTERWTLALRNGDVSISHRKGKADCVATLDARLFEALAKGEANAFTAALRGDIELEGQPALLLEFQRLFPGPPQDRRGQAAS
jgi:putative sterol carrier protein